MDKPDSILVIEASEVNRNLLIEILGSESYRVIAVSDCPTGLKAVEENDFNLILIDQGRNIHELSVEYKKLLELKTSIPVLLLCAELTQADTDSYLNSGIYRCINKPYDQLTLLNSVRQALAHTH